MTPKDLGDDAGKEDEEQDRLADEEEEEGSLRDAQHLIIIRHGDRWDYENPTAWKTNAHSRKGDPPLSALGHAQARETGRYLDSYFAEHDIEATDITWMSSPFLRTLQTSTNALDAMTSLPGSKQIAIYPENGVFEWDGHGGEWHASLPDLMERVHYFPRLLETAATYQSLHTPTLPEPRSQFQGRCHATLRALHQRHAFRPKSALVIVTHAAACIGLAVAASGRTLADIAPAAPCSLFLLHRWRDTPTWRLDAHDRRPFSRNGYVGHLSDVGNHTIPWNHFGDKRRHKGYTGPPTSVFAPESLKRRAGGGEGTAM